ncbi:MAG TPA: ABC transporter permease [Opitutus sp.]|nr:ABC transporter permease [Opitutus sp.]
MKLSSRFRALFRRAAAEAELRREIDLHLELEARRHEHAGLSPTEARAAALREFGGVEQAREACRDAWGVRWLDGLRHDFRQAARGLLRARGFSTVIVLTLALGIGAAAAIFSISKWTLFLQPDYPDDVYMVCSVTQSGASNPLLNDYMTRGYETARAVEEVAKSARMSGNVAVDGQPIATGWTELTSNLLPMLGIAPALGRGFLPGEDREGANFVVIISDEIWHHDFSADPNVLGRNITLGSDTCTVVGVLEPDQQFPPYLGDEIFRPLAYHVDPLRPWLPQLCMMVKLRSGYSPVQAAATLSGIKLDPPTDTFDDNKSSVVLVPLPIFASLFSRNDVFWVLLAAVGLLYAIACLNASNLMLVRMFGQRRELSIRLALGAGRWRVVRLLAAESLILTFLGAAGGVLVANWLYPVLLRVLGSGLFGRASAWWNLAWGQLDWRELVILGVLALATSLVIALVPAIRVLRSQLSVSLKDGGAALGESRALSFLRSSLVVLQAAFAVVLLAGAMLMIRTSENYQRIDLGYDGTNRLKLGLEFPPTYSEQWEARLVKLHEIQSELERVPGVQSAGFGDDVMLPGYFAHTHTVQGANGITVKTMIRCFSRGFEGFSGMRLIRGRPLHLVRGNEILVSESLARACWPGQDPIGQVLHPVGGAPGFGPDWPGWLVVGVVADMRLQVRGAPGMLFYSDEGWAPHNYKTFILKLTGSYDLALGGLIRRTLYAFDPQLVVTYLLPLDELRDSRLRVERMTDGVLRVLAGTALLLTVVGLISVLAYTVNARLSEFGVRVALGATSADLVRLVLGRGMLLATIGLILGLLAAFGLTRFVRALLYQTSAQDPVVLVSVCGLLLLASAIACAIPSHRATKVDVTKLLRTE